MSNDSKLTTLYIDKMSNSEHAGKGGDVDYASTDCTSAEDSISDDQSEGEEQRPRVNQPLVKKFQNVVKIGQIGFSDGKDEQPGGEGQKKAQDIQKKQITFDLKAVRALQNNIGLLSI